MSTVALQAKIQAWLATHWQGHHRCAICGHNAWTLSGDIQRVGTVPVVLIACTTCSYTMAFSAVILGLLP